MMSPQLIEDVSDDGGGAPDHHPVDLFFFHCQALSCIDLIKGVTGYCCGLLNPLRPVVNHTTCDVGITTPDAGHLRAAAARKSKSDPVRLFSLSRSDVCIMREAHL